MVQEPPEDYWGEGGGGEYWAPCPAPHLVRPLQAAVCYCDISILKTPKTLLRVLVLVSDIFFKTMLFHN